MLTVPTQPCSSSMHWQWHCLNCTFDSRDAAGSSPAGRTRHLDTNANQANSSTRQGATIIALTKALAPWVQQRC